jgi:hypothetical protein
MSDRLPDLVQRVVMDVQDYVAGIKEATSKLADLSRANMGTVETAATLRKEFQSLQEEARKLNRAMRMADPGAVEGVQQLRGQLEGLKSDLVGTTRATNEQVAALKRLMQTTGSMQAGTRGATGSELSAMMSALGVGPGTRGASAAELANMRARLGIGSGTRGATDAQVTAIKNALGLSGGTRGASPSELLSVFGLPSLGTRGATAAELANMRSRLGIGEGTIGATPAQVAAVKRLLEVTSARDNAFRNFQSAQLDSMLTSRRAGGFGIPEAPSLFRRPNFMGQAGYVGAGLSSGVAATGIPGAGAAGTLLGGLAIGGVGGLVGGGLAVAGQAFGSIIGTISSTISQAAGMVSSAVTNMVRSVVEGGAQLEKWRITFRILLGDADRGNKILGELQTMSTQTPFSFGQLADASQILLGMGVNADNLVAIMSRLGDVAEGDASRLRRLAVVFGEVEAEGKLTGWRIRQLASLGIGIGDMAKTMGVPSEAFRALTSANLVPGDILTKTLTRLTDPGGRFGEQNKNLLQSVSAQWDRLGNVIGVVASKMGEAFLKSSGLARGLSTVADAIQSMTENAVAFGKLAGQAFGNLLAVSEQLGRSFVGAFAELFKNTGFGDRLMNIIPGLRDLSKGAGSIGETFLNVAEVISKAIAEIIAAIGRLISTFLQLAHLAVNSPMAPEWLKQGLGALFPKEMRPQLAAPGEAGREPPLAGILRGMGFTVPEGARNMRQILGFDAVKGKGQLGGGMVLRNLTPDEALDKLEFQLFGPGLAAMAAAPQDTANLFGKWRTANKVGKWMDYGRGILQPGLSYLFGGGAGAGPNRNIFPNPFALSGLAQEVLGQVWGEAFGGKEKGGGGGTVSVLKAFQREMKAIDELQTKSGIAGTGRFLTGLGASIPGPIGQIAGALFDKIPDIGLPKGGLGEQRFESFEKLRKAVGGQVSDQLPTADLYGSAEAIDTINKTNVDNRSVMEEMLSTAQAALDLDRQQAEEMKEFNRNLQNLPPELAKFFGGQL